MNDAQQDPHQPAFSGVRAPELAQAFERELGLAAGALPLSPEEHEQRTRFLAAARSDAVTMNGTLILTARKG